MSFEEKLDEEIKAVKQFLELAEKVNGEMSESIVLVAEKMKATLARLEDIKVYQNPDKKWQPVGGHYYISSSGSIFSHQSDVPSKQFGTERQTKEQAERAAVEMCRFNRLLALRDELCGDEVLDWDNNHVHKCFLYFDHAHKKWHIGLNYTDERIQPYFTSKESAQRACDMLNSGEVEL